MSLFSGYKKEKSPEAEERLAEAEEIMNESDNCLSEAESVDAEEHNASEEPASEEEAEGFFKGQKSSEDVSKSLQNRITTLLAETK